jgi:uncharacterized protein (TIGR03086 family)
VNPAARHAEIAERFSTHARSVTDWDAPAPVAGWAARDVVDHLVTWLPGLLAADAVTLAAVPPTGDGPRAAWEAHAAAVQELLDGPDAGRDFTHPHLGTLPLDEAIDRFYTTDVFMHTWDLAEAAGRPSGLPEDVCAELLVGMEPMEEMLRSSGQYGPRVAVPAEASAVDQLMGFIGRDPDWRS